eukprot:CAMPEP_0201507214 /NCGR_PEP_ID=MMETSP0161_2-20130828/943_1 /ASSEMBLY_ACC=CAM_ASM_000251 /TAXON_ID=180227 /ORGANISM="Neoparamoeba aestuarina, Strain SoJaBio B1-5/56/2" /LENGTH=253 /DNA_ID=CAMNT_0047901517 /DNA_START=75 /DNA_END=836 /DNA_ORIENTATION=+
MAEVKGRITGFLQKRGEKGLVKSYKRRWFVFDANDGPKKVYYYHSPESKEELGSIQLSQVEEIRKTVGNDFEIVIPGRTYFLQATTPKEAEQWIAALQPHVGKSGDSLSGSSGSEDVLRQKDDQIAKLEGRVKELQAGGGAAEGLSQELKSLKEEFEAYKKSHSEGGGGGETGEKDEEITSLKAKLAKLDDENAKEMVELKREYFRACAIGIVQQRKITKDLPPVAELYQRCLDDNTEWRAYVSWIKTTLPKK